MLLRKIFFNTSVNWFCYHVFFFSVSSSVVLFRALQHESWELTAELNTAELFRRIWSVDCELQLMWQHNTFALNTTEYWSSWKQFESALHLCTCDQSQVCRYSTSSVSQYKEWDNWQNFSFLKFLNSVFTFF